MGNICPNICPGPKQTEKEPEYSELQNQTQDPAVINLLQQAEIYQNNQEHEKAKECYERFLEQNEDQNNETSANAYYNLGIVYTNLGEHQKAIELHSKALDIRKEVLGEKNPVTADTYASLGSLFNTTGEYQKAIACHSKALEIKREILGDTLETATCYDNLGVAYHNINEYQKAAENREKALQIAKALGVIANQNEEEGFEGNIQAAEHHTKRPVVVKAVLADTTTPTLGSAYKNLGRHHNSP